MNRSTRLTLCLAATLAAAVQTAAAHAAAITVPLDQTRRLTFNGTAANVVVGNPAIADVSIIDSRNLMVVGKKFGVTNLVVLDPQGRTLFDNEVLVSAGSGSVVSIYRGSAPSDYACTPYCQQVGGTDAAVQPSSPMPAMATSAPKP